MSQELREYDLIRVDNRHGDHPREARRLGVTATVGPTSGDMDAARGVQLTLETDDGYAYARVSEPQVRDLIAVLEKRIDPDAEFEATGIEAERTLIKPDGEEL